MYIYLDIIHIYVHVRIYARRASYDYDETLNSTCEYRSFS